MTAIQPLDRLIEAIRRTEATSPVRVVPINAQQLITLLATLATDPSARRAWRSLREHTGVLVHSVLRESKP